MSLAHALLAALVDHPNSGYELAKRFDGSVGFFWKASHQQIYRELAKLEAQKWIGFQAVSQDGRPDKKLYHVTELGQKQLAEWIDRPCELAPLKDELLVKVFAGRVAPTAVVLELKRHRITHQERLAVYKQIEKETFIDPSQLPLEAKFPYLTLRQGIRYETEWLAWCDEALQMLADQSSQ